MYYSDSDSDIETYNNENLYYEPEEHSLTKYNIIICELYNKNIHGKTNDLKLKESYLTIYRYKIFDIREIIEDAEFYYSQYRILNNNRKKHDIYRNYQNIVNRENYIKPEIAECIYLENGMCIAILKTFWIRLIQRRWRNIYIKRIEIIRKRSNIKSLKYREIYGEWNIDCLELPKLKGMLSFL